MSLSRCRLGRCERANKGRVGVYRRSIGPTSLRPAAFNGLVGFKPSFGWWSARGVVPACRTLDCVSVLAGSVADARAVAGVAGGFDFGDAYSRRIEFTGFDVARSRAGVIDPERVAACDADHASAYRTFLASTDDTQVEIDPAPLFEAGRLLYEGPWLAERFAVLESFMADRYDDMHPVTRDIIAGGAARRSAQPRLAASAAGAPIGHPLQRAPPRLMRHRFDRPGSLDDARVDYFRRPRRGRLETLHPPPKSDGQRV